MSVLALHRTKEVIIFVLLLQVFAYFPKAVETGGSTSVIFVMHGVKRDAEEEFRRTIPLGASEETLLPEEHNFVLLVPEFSAELFPKRNSYNFGNIFEVRAMVWAATCFFVRELLQ